MGLQLKPETQARLEAHAARLGLSADKFVEALVERELPEAESQANGSSGIQFRKEHGLWLFRTGEPMPLSMISDTVQAMRREREDHILGHIA
jgi:hypothetical protein